MYLISIPVEDYTLTTLDEAKSNPVNECRDEGPFAPTDLSQFIHYIQCYGFGIIRILKSSVT